MSNIFRVGKKEKVTPKTRTGIDLTANNVLRYIQT